MSPAPERWRMFPEASYPGGRVGASPKGKPRPSDRKEARPQLLGHIGERFGPEGPSEPQSLRRCLSKLGFVFDRVASVGQGCGAVQVVRKRSPLPIRRSSGSDAANSSSFGRGHSRRARSSLPENDHRSAFPVPCQGVLAMR